MESGKLCGYKNLVSISIKRLGFASCFIVFLFLLAGSEVHMFCSLLGFDLTGSLPLALVLAAGTSSVWFSLPGADQGYCLLLFRSGIFSCSSLKQRALFLPLIFTAGLHACQIFFPLMSVH
jgi:hypothetical protein